MEQTRPILATKLFVPPPRPQFIARPHLMQILDSAVESKLILVSASPGFGKTTCISTWHASRPTDPLAWVALDEGDNDPVRFIAYVLAACESFMPEIRPLSRDHHAGLAGEAVLIQLINTLTTGIAARALAHIFLVFDDYHVITNAAVHSLTTYLLEHMPPQMHLILISRRDPPLPLHRLRGRNQMREIRAPDLRFTTEESAQFMQQATGLVLDQPALDQLARHIEGWVTGLQLAALSLKGSSTGAAFFTAISGNNRFILEYLGEEVLRLQPERIRTFLLKTALLERFTADLVTAVTGELWTDSDLAQVEQANLFLVSLDTTGQWYRYHPLFAEFLRHHVREDAQLNIAEIHRRACAWFADHHLLSEAISHAFAIPDAALAALLIERIARPLIIAGEFGRIERWLERVPDTILHTHPDLCLSATYSFFFRGQIGAHARLLTIAEEGFRAADDSRKRSAVFILRSHFAQLQNDPTIAIAAAEQALTLVAEDDVASAGEAYLVLTEIYLNAGDVKQALQYAHEAYRRLQPSATQGILRACVYTLGVAYTLTGNLSRAVAAFQEGIALGDVAPTKNAQLFYINLSHIYLEWHDRATALRYLREAEALADVSQQARFWPVGANIYARLWWTSGTENPIVTESTLTDGSALLTNIQAQLASLRARFQETAAQQFPDEEDDAYTFDEVRNYLAEPEYIAIVRRGFAHHQLPEVLAYLETLHDVAANQGRVHSQIKIRILQALVHQAQGENSEAALTALTEALTLAETGGYIHAFTEEGPPMLRLLRLATPQIVRSGVYLNTLMAAFTKEQRDDGAHPLEAASRVGTPPGDPRDVLSERERMVLDLLVQGASNQEIAEALTITLSTVKKHTNSIYTKFAVANRTQALIRARELGLV